VSALAGGGTALSDAIATGQAAAIAAAFSGLADSARSLAEALNE